MRRVAGAVLVAMVVVLSCAAEAQAQLHTEAVEYRHGEAVLEGYLAYDSRLAHPVPGVLVVHEWKGLNEYAKRRARQLAELGYVAFAIDMYGQGIVAADHAEAGRLSGIYLSDRRLMRDRARVGLHVLLSQPLVDTTRVAAIGYCFGGTTVLELARDGADVAAVVSFHGSLSTPHPEDARQIKGKVLILQGANDSFTLDEVPAFEQEMQEAGVDYQLIRYEGAVHSFTVPEAGDDPSTGAAYHPEADQRSWEEMRRLLEQLFHVQNSGLEALVAEADAIVMAEILATDYQATAADGPMYGEARVVRVLRGKVLGAKVRFGASAWMGPTYQPGELRVLLLESIGAEDAYYAKARWVAMETGKAEILFPVEREGWCTEEALRTAMRQALPTSDGRPPRLLCPPD